MFRKAVDCGRKIGGRRMIFALYDECQEIWAGSPAVNSIDDGIESSFSNATIIAESIDLEDNVESTDVIEEGKNIKNF